MSTNTPTRIISIGTAVPKNEYLQSDLAHWMHKRLDEKNERLGRIFQALYRKTKIEKRYSVLHDFNSNLSSAELFVDNTVEPRVEERLAIYDREAILLAKKSS